MYDTSIPTLAYVFISLTSLVITYSHIMSNQDEATNQDGMPEFVDKEIMDAVSYTHLTLPTNDQV